MKGRKRLDFSDSRFRLRNVFFIHCPGYPRENSLKREIIKYGGKVESFLSKDVQVLVTNQSNNENRGSSAPLSPLSTCTSSSRMHTDSPLNTERPSTAILTRGKALALQAAKLQCNGSTDVMENSKRMGVRVWSLETAVRAIKRAKREENRQAIRNEEANSNPQGFKSLKAPFLKVEDVSHRFKPLSTEFESWPVMEYLARLSLDPGFQHGKLVTPSNSPAKHSPSKLRVQPLLAVQRMNTLHMNQLMERQGTLAQGEKSPIKKQIAKKSPQEEKKGILKKQQPLERRGYCEACLSRYSNLQEHRLTSSHKLFVSNQDNFSKLDRAISEFCPLEHVVRNFSSLASLISETIHGSVGGGRTSPDLLPSSPQSPQLSPYTPSKVRDSARHTPQTCISFRPDPIFLSYTPIDTPTPISPPHNLSPPCLNFITDPDVLSTPRILKPRPAYLPAVSAPNTGTETAGHFYTIPIDSPKLGSKPEITVLIPSCSPEVSSMEWCESITQACPAPTDEPMVPGVLSNDPQEQGATSLRPNAAVEAPTPKETCFKTPSKQNRRSQVCPGDAKTPPLPKDMDTRLFQVMSYPYRQSKINAFKKLSKLL